MTSRPPTRLIQCRIEAMARAGLLLAVTLVLAACQPGEDRPRQQTDDLPPVGEALVAQERETCEADGGTFGRAPNGLNLCFRTPRDSGRSCTQNADCEGVCLARSRTCAPLIPLVGCNDVLIAPGRAITECRQQP